MTKTVSGSAADRGADIFVRRIPGTVFILIAGAYVIWGWSDQLGNLVDDAVYYLLMARSYSPWHAHDAAATALTGSSHFPPLYPVLLGLFGAADNQHVAQMLNVGFLLGALLLLYRWVCDEGLSPLSASAVVVIVALLPGSYLEALYPQSEFLYLLFSVMALLFLYRHECSRKDSDLWIAALAVTAALLTRALGVALLLPLLVSSLRSSGIRRLWLPIVVFAPALLLRLLHRAQFDYLDIFIGYYHNGFVAGLRHQLTHESTSLLRGLSENFALGRIRTAHLVVTVLLAAAVLSRALRFKNDGNYVVAYLGIVLLWPFPSEARRFMWCIIPIAIGQLLISAEAVLRRIVSGSGHVRSVAILSLLTALLLLPLSFLPVAIDRYEAGNRSGIENANRYIYWYQEDARLAEGQTRVHQSLIGALTALPDSVPAEDCVISTKPEWVAYFARRRSVHPPLPAVSESQFYDELIRSGCRYVFMVSFSDQLYPEPMYPRGRLEGRLRQIDAGGIYTSGNSSTFTTYILGQLQ